MATNTFAALPAEIHVIIAEYCESHHLINLCLTAKWVHERCLRVLYRHVDLRDDHFTEYSRVLDARKRKLQFVHTVLNHPEYGMHVRFLKTRLYIPNLDDSHSDRISEEELWRAMRSLTNVQSVAITSKNLFSSRNIVPMKQLPHGLFRTATSVSLDGEMEYGLAKSILTAINPATLTHLCLDMIQDCRARPAEGEFVPGDRGEDGQLIALGATSGLLTTLTGRCTALRTLILRRIGQDKDSHGQGWHSAAEEASYIEWASFIRSVHGTVAKFQFEQAGGWLHDLRLTGNPRPLRIMDERFRRLILPAIVTGDWPRLTLIELRGVRTAKRDGGKAGLKMKLRDVFSDDTNIVVKKYTRFDG